jgi:outer membrane protein assembly factor BamB
MKYHLILVLMLATVSAVRAEDWPQWRGPHFNGSSDEKNLPSDWSQTENIAWKADLPGSAAATPIVWENHLFLSGVDTAKNVTQAMALDRTSGKLLWSHDISTGIRKDQRSNFAAASPVTDGKVVVFFYGNGDLVAFDFAGNRLWSRNLQKDYGPFSYYYWTVGCSPLLYGGKLYVSLLQHNLPEDDHGSQKNKSISYLLAADPRTGETLWRHFRLSEAVGETQEGYVTPIPAEYNGRKQLLIAGGDALSGHDPDTGRELWRWGNWNPKRETMWPQVASAAVFEDLALVCVPKGQPIYAIKIGGDGIRGDDAIAWTSRTQKKVTTEVPTPAVYDGDFFILSDTRRSLSRVAAKTGEVKWTTPVKGSHEASPLAADGKIYTINFDGLVTILRASDGSLIRTIPMDEKVEGDPVRASIIASHGQLFIRTTSKLYCVGRATDQHGAP